MKEILLSIESKELRCAILIAGRMVDLVIERKRSRQTTGYIYRGRVNNILQNIQSAFIDIGKEDNGFIHIDDILENTKKLEKQFDLDFERVEQKEEAKEIDQVLKPDQVVMVQVIKEAIGSKGARLTSKISLPGRYLVLLPNSSHRGVSRRIEERGERDRLKRVLRSVELPEGMGVICRTASLQATQEVLIEEMQELLNTWQGIVEKFQEATGPTLLFEESDLTKRMLLQALDNKYDRVLTDHYATYQRLKRLYKPYADEHPLKIEFYRDKMPMMERFHVDREIDKALKHKIWLSGGGYLFFDRTEAMHTVDVNSGRSGKGKTDLEESLVQINLDAAEEIARQLAIRNIGGLIICDFIDMRSSKNRRRVLDKLRECMKGDSAKVTILGMSEFGLVEMTRQRSRESLVQTLCDDCPYCDGQGVIKSPETMAIELERGLKKILKEESQFALRLVVHPQLENYLKTEDRKFLVELADQSNTRLEVTSSDELHLNDYRFYSSLNDQLIEV
jgi:ribonuclease G